MASLRTTRCDPGPLVGLPSLLVDLTSDLGRGVSDSLGQVPYRLAYDHGLFARMQAQAAVLGSNANASIRDLSRQVGHPCHLSFIVAGKVFVIAQAGPSRSNVGACLGAGSVLPMMLCASGQLLLAYAPPKKRAELLSDDCEYLALTGTQRQAFSLWLEAVRDGGCLVLRNYYDLGAVDFCTLAGDPESEFCPALTVTFSCSELPRGKKRALFEGAVRERLRQLPGGARSLLQ